MISDDDLRKAAFLLDNRRLLQSTYAYDKSMISGDNWSESEEWGVSPSVSRSRNQVKLDGPFFTLERYFSMIFVSDRS